MAALLLIIATAIFILVGYDTKAKSDIKAVINGKNIEITDIKNEGKTFETLKYNGKSFLPVELSLKLTNEITKRDEIIKKYNINTEK